MDMEINGRLLFHRFVFLLYICRSCGDSFDFIYSPAACLDDIGKKESCFGNFADLSTCELFMLGVV